MPRWWFALRRSSTRRLVGRWLTHRKTDDSLFRTYTTSRLDEQPDDSPAATSVALPSTAPRRVLVPPPPSRGQSIRPASRGPAPVELLPSTGPSLSPAARVQRRKKFTQSELAVDEFAALNQREKQQQASLL